MARQADSQNNKVGGKRASQPSADEKKGAGKKEKKIPVISLRHLRLRVKDIELTDALENQRGTPWPDLSRRIYERGCQLEAASGPPDEEGKYGTYTGQRLAQLLAGDVESLINFQMRNGQVPTILQVMLDLVQNQGPLPAALLALQQQGKSSSEEAGTKPLMTVEDGAVSTLDIFFKNG